MLAPQLSHRLSSENETSLDPTASRPGGVQPGANHQTAGFDGSQETHTAADFSTTGAQASSATIGARQRGQVQAANIPVSPRQTVIGLDANWRERGSTVSDQNVQPVNSDYVQHFPNTLSVGELSRNNVRE